MDIEILRKYSRQLIIAFGFLVLTILVGWFVFLLLEQPNPAYGVLNKQKFQNLATKDTKWSAEGATLISSLKKAGVYELIERGFTPKQAKAIAAKLSFNGEPKTQCNLGQLCKSKGDNLYSWSTFTADLTINLITGELHYKNFSALKERGNKTKAEGDLATNAKQALTDLGLSTDMLTVNKLESGFFKNTTTDFVKTNSLEDSDFVSYVFDKQINKLLVRNLLDTDYASVQITKFGQIYSLSYVNSKFEDNKNVSYPLLDGKEAKKKLGEGSGYFTKFSDTASLGVGQFLAVYVGQGDVYLYDDMSSDFLQPIYIFQAAASGTSTFAKGEVYLPAIQDKYLR